MEYLWLLFFQINRSNFEHYKLINHDILSEIIIFVSAGENIVDYLISVCTDLLHSQRDPLALCLMFQLYDRELQSLSFSSYPQLYQFSQYYSLWIRQQTKEALVGESSQNNLKDSRTEEVSRNQNGPPTVHCLRLTCIFTVFSVN